MRGCVDETYSLIRIVDLVTSGLRHCTQTGLAVAVDRLCQPVVVREEEDSIAANRRLALFKVEHIGPSRSMMMLTTHWHNSGFNFAMSPTFFSIPRTGIGTLCDFGPASVGPFHLLFLYSNLI